MSETSEKSSENEKCKRPKGSRRRQVHNEVERRRKDKINGWISKIGELLPYKELHKQSKISILEQTVHYIKLLASERDKLLSENCSEVQAEEIKKLKRDIKFLSEQNTLYEKLLEQSNVTLKPLPSKELKYSNKFVRKNGVLAVKNTESNVITHVDRAVQVNSMCLNIPVSSDVNCTNSATNENLIISSNCRIAKPSKPYTKYNSSVLKPVKIVSSVTTCSVVKPPVPVTCIQSNSVVNSSLLMQASQPSNSVSEESDIPVINWNETVRNSTSFHSGGVTTVLSQFPVMSTNHGSSFSNVCNKNIPTFIIPTGGGIVQQFLTEKPSNTINVICPSTLPILVPQQVFSVPSVARNMGLPSTIICPGPVDNNSTQVDKSALGGTLLTINSNSVVPISSSFPSNARIILQSQPTMLGNTCSNVTLTQNVATPFVTTVSQSQSDNNLSVPLIQKQQPVSSPSKKIEVLINRTNNPSVSKINNQETKIAKHALENNTDIPVITSDTLPSNISKESGNHVKSSEQNKSKILNRDLRNLYSNTPPSLQVLSANKIISLANNTSKKGKTNIILPLNKKNDEKHTDDCIPVINENKSNESENNLHSDSTKVKYPQREVNELSETNKRKVNFNNSSIEHTQISESNLAKSNFSLTVLIGDSSTGKDTPNSKVSSLNNISLSSEKDISARVQFKNISSNASNSLLSASYSNTSEYGEISSITKQNILDSSAEASEISSACNSEINSVCRKINICDSQKLSNQNILSRISSNISNVSVSTNSIELDKDTLVHHNNSTITNNNVSSYNLNVQNTVSKQNSQSLNVSSKSDIQINNSNIVNNDQNLTITSNSEISSSVMNTCKGNVAYTINDASVNQSLLPSLFSSNQIVGLNSSVLVCHTVHDNASSLLLPNTIQVSSDSTEALNNCLLHDSNSDFSTFPIGNKEVIMTDDLPKNVSKNASTNSTPNILNKNGDLNEVDKNKKIENSQESNSSKQYLASKRKNKSVSKEGKANSSDKIVTNGETPLDVSDNTVLRSSQVADIINLPKSDSSSCTRQDSNFIFASDILARATESIFGNDILESPQMPKRNDGCYSDESSNLNVPLSTTDRTIDDSYRMQYSIIEEDHSISDASTEKSKKASSSELQHSEVSSSHNLQTNEQSDQELNCKQNKLCKSRKPKTIGDSEPPCKKMKEISQNSEKSHTLHIYTAPHQVNKDKHISSIHSNLSFLEKQVTDATEAPIEDPNGVGSMGNFPNHIQLSDTSCKTPSVDAIFSLTPMLGDILKDVSHNVNLDSRNSNFLMGNENQSIYSSEKNIISFSYSNNSNEDYLNLPRFPFPIIPEISSAPIVHVTNVSFAHSVSLCSTQSDSQKSSETLSSTDSQNKSNSKQKDILPLFHNNSTINLDLNSTTNMSKQSECVLKMNNSEPHFNITSAKVTSNSSESQFNMTSAKVTNTNSVLFDGQNSDVQSQNLNSLHSTNLGIPQSVSQYNSRENFIPAVPHSISFYPCISTSSNIQNFACTTSSVSHASYHNSSSIGSVPISFQTSGTINNSFNSQPVFSKTDSLSHSLCSLLKENSTVSENRCGSNETSSQNTTTSHVIQSKYSALSLISDQTSYSESVSVTTSHPHFVQTSTVYTSSGSDGQYVSTASSCGRNPKTSLSYSAESLLQTSCANTEKNKNKNNNNRYPLRTAEKKADHSNIANIHSLNDTNIFMPASSCDISIQNVPLVPLPPVHNFPPAYTMCDTVPSTTIFNSSSRTQDIPPSLSNDNYHMNLNVDPQMLNTRHEVTSSVPKPHSNIPLPFENHNTLYNNCNFLPHVKPTLEGSRSSDASACFQSSSYSNNYSQPSHKPNCCHFSHRATNSELSNDINSSVAVTAAPFHNDKNNFQPNRVGLQASFSQSNSNFMGNYFYSTTANCRDGNDMNIKPSTIRTSQEMYVPDGMRQNIHDQTPGVVFNSRKAIPSNRTKSKKLKNTTSNENNSSVPPCITNYSVTQDGSCNKSNLPYVPNGYFKSSSHSVLPSPAQLQCSQNKISEAVIPPNPPFNPVLHQQGENFLNLNFQHPNFTMSPLPRPPTQPLSCSCLTTPIISHTFSSSTPHPVPNFNLSNILPDMGCSGNQVSFSPAKFPMNHPLTSTSSQCQTNPTITNSAHIVSHQSCAPSLYPPHPPIVRGSLNPILGPNSQSLIDSQVSLVGAAGAVMSQNTLHTKIHCNTKSFFS